MAIGVEPVHGEREPQGQAPGAPGQVEGVIARVPLLGLSAVQDVQVLGVLGVHGLGQVGLAVDQGGAVERREEPFVGIHNERVGPLEAGKLVPYGRREQGGSAAVGAVDVKPQGLLGGDVRHPGQVVHDAGVRRACRGHDADDVVASRISSNAARSAGPVNR